MGEIKSTLEIIMEKTEGLTMSDDEKKAFRKKEVEGKVKGLLLKFIDGLTNLKSLKKEIASLDKDDQVSVKEIVIKECLDHVDPETDNSLLFDVLQHVACVDTTYIQSLLSKFHDTLDREKGVRERGLRKLIQGKGISGLAVLPNLNADKEWIHFVTDIKKRFQKNLRLDG